VKEALDISKEEITARVVNGSAKEGSDKELR
jgi:hypothetical protein